MKQDDGWIAHAAYVVEVDLPAPYTSDAANQWRVNGLVAPRGTPHAPTEKRV
jgi:hypothetical protein